MIFRDSGELVRRRLSSLPAHAPHHSGGQHRWLKLPSARTIFLAAGFRLRGRRSGLTARVLSTLGRVLTRRLHATAQDWQEDENIEPMCRFMAVQASLGKGSCDVEPAIMPPLHYDAARPRKLSASWDDFLVGIRDDGPSLLVQVPRHVDHDDPAEAAEPEVGFDEDARLVVQQDSGTSGCRSARG